MIYSHSKQPDVPTDSFGGDRPGDRIAPTARGDDPRQNQLGFTLVQLAGT